MVKIILVLSLFIFLLIPQVAHAQVRYEDVIEKIHYTDGMSYSANNQPVVVAKEIGSSNPTLKVYIYGDFSETYTKKFFDGTFEYLKNKYQDARFIFRNAVFLGTDNGMQTAFMVNCLATQNHFWDNVQSLINIADLNNPNFKNIDTNQFNDCVKNSNTKSGVNIENDLAKYYGFNSFPTIVIQNTAKPQDYSVKVSGAQSTDIFDRAFLEAKEGDLAKQDLEELKADVALLKEDVKQTKQEVSGLRALIENILQQFQALFTLFRR